MICIAIWGLKVIILYAYSPHRGTMLYYKIAKNDVAPPKTKGGLLKL